MTKEHIIAEIRRTAADNGGVPLGLHLFRKVTGITRETWLGKFWRRWSEAVEEAGFTPNERTAAIGRDALIEHLAVLIRETGRFPTDAEIGLARTKGAQIPHHHRFRQLGTRSMRIELVRAFVRQHPEFQDVVALLPAASDGAEPEAREGAEGLDGAVYMLKLAKHYKIGKSFRVPQRHREIAIELPEKPDVVHVITTDDPSGIEAYWHKRFDAKRTNGEWFALAQDDVRAFKRRKFM